MSMPSCESEDVVCRSLRNIKHSVYLTILHVLLNGNIDRLYMAIDKLR